VAWGLVRRQHGVIARWQLERLGYSRHAIAHRVRSGRLRRIGPAVYAIGGLDLTQRGRWMGAILSCGEHACLTHGSAAALWGFGRELAAGIEVATGSTSPRNRPGVRIHRRRSLRPASITERERIAVTTPVQTIVDLSTRYGRRSLEGMISDATRCQLFTPPSLRAALGDHAGEPGVAILRGILDRRSFRLTRSDLERTFLPVAAGLGLPVPLTKQMVNGFEVDFFWPDLRLVVESDGLTYHRAPAEQAQDRLRDQAHTAAGYANLRFTDEQVRYERDYVRRRLSETAQRLGFKPR
jgi:very-short-patch-repair endonuclease